MAAAVSWEKAAVAAPLEKAVVAPMVNSVAEVAGALESAVVVVEVKVKVKA